MAVLRFATSCARPLFAMIRAQAQLRVILQHRIDRGTMSLLLLSRKTGIGTSHLSNWRHGNRAASLQALHAIAHALGFRVELVPIAGETAPPEPRGRAARLSMGPHPVQIATRDEASIVGAAYLRRARQPKTQAA
jgi:transcriptional regulator with XRE-family HTH domain